MKQLNEKNFPLLTRNILLLHCRVVACSLWQSPTWRDAKQSQVILSIIIAYFVLFSIIYWFDSQYA